MFCSKCGKPIPEGSAFCSECGAPVLKAGNAVTEAAGKTENATAEETARTKENSTEAGAKTENSVAETTEKTEKALQEAVETATGEPAGKKKKKGKAGLVLGIILGIVLLLGAAAGATYFFAKEQVENFIHVKFDKPEAYYQYVARKNLDRTEAILPEGYDELVKKQMDIFNSAFHQKVQVKLGDRGKDFLKLAVGSGIDITWIDSVAVDYSMDLQEKNDKFSFGAKAILNNEQIISGLFLMDMKEGRAVFQVPELTEKYGEVSIEDEYELEEVKELFGKYARMIESYPDVSYLQEKVKEYVEMYLEQVEEVEKSTESLEADDVTMECTSLTVILREKDLKKLIGKILDDLAEDEEMAKTVKAIAEIADEDPEEFYAEYLKNIEDSRKDLEENFSIDRVRWVTYVDKNSNVIGRKLIVDPKEERVKSIETEFLVLPKEDKLGIHYSYSQDDHKVVFMGTGQVKSDKLDGDFRVKYDDKKVMNLSVEEFDLEAAKKGNLVGHFNFKPGSDVDLIGELCDAFGLAEDSPAKVFLSALNLSLDLKVEYTLEKHSVDVGIQDGGLDIVRISVSGEMDESGSLALPADAIDVEENSQDYLKELKFNKIIDALKKANVPEEYYEELNELEEELKDYLEYMENIRNFNYQ